MTTYLFDSLHITECQVDELWSFVRKKEAHLTVAERVLALYGDAWVWIAFVPAWRLVAAFCCGQTRSRERNVLLERLHAVSCGYIPFFTSDQLPHYSRALLRVYGIPASSYTSLASAGPSPYPNSSHLLTCIMPKVVKRRKRGRVVHVTTKIIFGSEEAVEARLAASPEWDDQHQFR